MMDLETIVAGGNTLRHTEMTLLDKHQKESMSGYGPLCGGSAAASESRTIGKRICSSSNKTRVSSKADASFCIGTRQTIKETARRANGSSLGSQDIASTSLAHEAMDLFSLTSIFDHPSVTEDIDESSVALQLPSPVSTDCCDGEHKSATSQRDIQSATRPSITFESNEQIPTYRITDIINDLRTAYKGKTVDKAGPESDRYEVERVVGHDGCKGQRLYLVKWKGYKEETWEPEEYLDDCAEALEEYWDSVDGDAGRKSGRVR
jgi:hypothetical protein